MIPKCSVLKESRRAFFNKVRNGNTLVSIASDWFDVSVGEKTLKYGASRTSYHVNCPFCGSKMASLSIADRTTTAPIEVLRSTIAVWDSYTSCVKCEIRITWDFASDRAEFRNDVLAAIPAAIDAGGVS